MVEPPEERGVLPQAAADDIVERGAAEGELWRGKVRFGVPGEGRA